MATSKPEVLRWICLALISSASHNGLVRCSLILRSSEDDVLIATPTSVEDNVVKGQSGETTSCAPGFICFHGNCTGYMKCTCNEGWAGLFCQEECPPDCALGGACISNDMICLCNDTSQYAPGLGCVETVSLQNRTQSPATDLLEQVQEDGSYGDPWAHLEGPLRPLPERFCIEGFVCAHGNCSFKNESFSCRCEPGFIGTFCQRKCGLNCGKHGVCQISGNVTQCFCNDQRHTGPNCTEVTFPEEAGSGQGESSGWMIGLGVGAAVLLFLLALFIPYILWRRRNIPLLKIIYWLQRFEEDDDREYDGFVSYASTNPDRQFVLATLLPMLEGQMRFTLCIHQRDFTPGIFISDNITESVKKSRRTILIISPAFINSGWCRFEYQMALQEMLSQRHRILPILLEDITSWKNEMDETLKSILNTVTWLEYPGEDATEQAHKKFWTCLALSMPKKRPNQVESVTSLPSFPPPPTLTSTPLNEATHLELKMHSELHSIANGSATVIPVLKIPASKHKSFSEKTVSASSLYELLHGKSRNTDSVFMGKNIPSSTDAKLYPPLMSSPPASPDSTSYNVHLEETGPALNYGCRGQESTEKVLVLTPEEMEIFI